MGLTQRELCPESTAWFAVSVKHQHERRTQSALAAKSVPTLLPLYRTRARWSDRVKETELPLFAGYLFCRFTRAERTSILATPGVRSIVGFGGVPAPIESAEIEALETMLASNLPVSPWPYLKPGDRVRVEHGPLRGLEGALIREKDSFRLVIGIQLLQRSIAAELEAEMISPIGKPC
jgi:transcription antitermination factor NusG